MTSVTAAHSRLHRGIFVLLFTCGTGCVVGESSPCSYSKACPSPLVCVSNICVAFDGGSGHSDAATEPRDAAVVALDAGPADGGSQGDPADAGPGDGGSGPAACDEGAVTNTCACGTATVATGYCCSGVAQAGACATGWQAGRIGWWPLDGNANDMAGNHDGVVVGATPSGVSRCGTGAYAFDGVASYVNLGDLRPATFTIAAWFKTDTAGAMTIYRYRLSGNLIQMTASGHIEAGLYDASGTQYSVASSGTSWADDAWHHVAYAYDGSNQALYMDGVQVDSGTAGTVYYGAGYAAIGRDGNSSSQYWNGLIDEVMLWNRALTSAEVTNLYASCPAATCTGPATQTCTITNGTGAQSRTCSSGTWSSWGTCQVVSCNGGYVQSGNTCVAFSGTIFHVDPSGTDSAARNGSSASPWKSLAYACSRVMAPGDLIHVNAGSYLETSQCQLAVGVSIEGEGDASVIHSSVGGSSFTISLASGSENTKGNQHVSGIKMDGDNLTAHGAIQVANRGNVEIHHCTIVNFDSWGVSFYNGEPPTTYATGNKLHDCTITNCASFYGGAQGDIQINGQDGLEINNNTVTQNRGTDDGDVIYGVEGFVKNLKIHHNTFSKTFTAGMTSWDFAIEIWNWLGGNEIYNNTITGSIDVVMCSKGAAAYSVWIHDNVIRQPALKAHQGIRGVLFELEVSDALVERNLIENVVEGIYFQQSTRAIVASNVTIRYNVFNNIGGAAGVPSPSGWGIYFSEEDYNDNFSNVNIYNNTVIAHQGGVNTAWGIGIPDTGAATNVNVRNNIVQGFGMAPVAARGTGGTTIDGLSIESNIFYQNGNSNTPEYFNGMSPTNNTTQNNATAAPPFVSVSDFHLTAARPGMFVAAGLTDKDGHPVANPPTIGAYEYP